MTDAACKGEPLAIWFDYEDGPYTEGLATARSYCDTCPNRAPCFFMACEAEGNDSADYRAGIFGGMTPQQRHAFNKRGLSYGCGKCGQAYDPVDLRKGVAVCECNTQRFKPIADRGDLWTERHTKLARMALSWLIENVDDGVEVPDALALSRTMKVGVKDLRRVYQALREDRILKRTDTGKLVLHKAPAAIDIWLPKHLRKTIHT